MLKIGLMISTLMLAAYAGNIAQASEDTEAEEESTRVSREVVIPLNEVPLLVRDVAFNEKPGMYITRVVRQLDDDDSYYYLFFGSQVNRFWTIRVRSDGKLMYVIKEPAPPPPLPRD